MGAIATILAKAALEAFGNMFLDWLRDQQAAQAREDLGASKTIAATNKETSDAERRASQVAVNAPDIDDFLHDLVTNGKF